MYKVKDWRGYPNLMCESEVEHSDHVHSDKRFGRVHCMGRLTDGSVNNEERVSRMDTNSIDTTCDGMFLIADTARHNGWDVDEQDVRDHVAECEDCYGMDV